MQAILNEYQAKDASLSSKKAAFYKQVQDCSKAMTKDLVEKANADSLLIFENQKKVDAVLGKLTTQKNTLYQHIKAWQKEYDDVTETLKEVGDLANWYDVIESKLKIK
jgi:hypothetical protein